MQRPFCSCTLIVKVYNQAAALRVFLQRVARGSHVPEEVVVADDGSGPEVAAVVEQMRAEGLPYTLIHCWQRDEGNRPSLSSNRALAASRGEYVIFTDADCIPNPRFVEDHLCFAEEGYYVQGHRTHIRQERVPDYIDGRHTFTGLVLRRGAYAAREGWRAPFFKEEVGQPINHILGSNMSFRRADLEGINGFDEELSARGWGHEDLDLVLRLYKTGIRQRYVRFRCIQFHLDHPLASREGSDHKHRLILERYEREDASPWARKGLDRHLRGEVESEEPSFGCSGVI